MPAARATCLAVLLLALAAATPCTASDAFARGLVPRVPPGKLEAQLLARPETIAPTLKQLGDALMTNDPQLQLALEQYLPQVALAYAHRISGSFSREQHLGLLTVFQLVDPMRYLEDAEFRARVDVFLPRTLDTTIDVKVRDAALRELNDVLRIDFDVSESLARAWGFEPRDTASRRIAFDAKSLRMPDDVSRIEASIFSINSAFSTATEARAFLKAVRASVPKRRIIVLSDLPLADAGVDVIDTRGRAYTPWPRDPFTIASTANGSVVFVNRPNLQPDREEDANLVRGLIQGLPQDIDDAWKARWTTAPVPFHNGHILLTPDAAWISVHTVEIRALELLGLGRVPIDTFNTTAGITKYQTAVREAAGELSALYQRPVHFVHPLDADPALMRNLAGGGGIDLDSVVTLLPPKTALVGDIALGAKLAREANWSRAHAAYGFTGDAKTLGTRIADAQSRALGVFLDTVAASLAVQGMIVRRIPLIRVPASLIAQGVEKDFLLTWNNVVLEETRAEGFASLLDEGDAIARDAFKSAGYALTLHPPLIRSVQLSGGYRCASNHVRVPTARRTAGSP